VEIALFNGINEIPAQSGQTAGAVHMQPEARRGWAIRSVLPVLLALSTLVLCACPATVASLGRCGLRVAATSVPLATTRFKFWDSSRYFFPGAKVGKRPIAKLPTSPAALRSSDCRVGLRPWVCSTTNA
jgi:hypothetical protein